MRWYRLKRELVATKIEVGVLGATGPIGEHLLSRLDHHPWFQTTWVSASDGEVGRRMRDVPWRAYGQMPAGFAELKIERLRPGAAPRLVFSALPAPEAGEAERAFAAAGHFVVSATPNFRLDPLVPLLVADINPQHLGLLESQRSGKQWRGSLVTSPSFVARRLATLMAALREFEVERAIVARADGPAVGGEKNLGEMEWGDPEIEAETKKVLGRLVTNGIEPHPVLISVQGAAGRSDHELVWLELGRKIGREQVKNALLEFRGLSKASHLPSAWEMAIAWEAESADSFLADSDNRPGSEVQVAGFRDSTVLDFKFKVAGPGSDDTVAVGALQNVELLIAWSLRAGWRIES
ncbi:MAG TPA: hypothetical protein VFI45_02905 [Candidatus Acidoferrum sp.]|nr:hypothetical protein [Candidatus Acidoferrum sp.]